MSRRATVADGTNLLTAKTYSEDNVHIGWTPVAGASVPVVQDSYRADLYSTDLTYETPGSHHHPSGTDSGAPAVDVTTTCSTSETTTRSYWHEGLSSPSSTASPPLPVYGASGSVRTVTVLGRPAIA